MSIVNIFVTMWHDVWSEAEPLSTSTTRRHSYAARLSDSTTSADVIEESIQKQPDDWIQQFPTLQNLGVHMFNQQSKDRINQSATRKE
uniref:Uncharacterized protein n=1 Tax=Tanacetum cinerariifolium TaxID=118510 RepID=A0A699H832_TANCI|nr:hypothetical protein [Tanacetum cinerariifolium]